MNNTTLMQFAKFASQRKYAELVTELRKIRKTRDHRKWGFNAHKLADWIESGMENEAPYTVFIKGNSKLPFYAFSALPFVTCPGMGTCSKYCYSIKAWRYPAAFFRQLQNTLLVGSVKGWNILQKRFESLPANATLRLYVDGDFDSLFTMQSWFELLAIRPDVQCYGYSKSWHIFLAYAKSHTFPGNYTLNLSSGSRFASLPAMLEQMRALPIVRGEFVAVKVSTKAPDKASNLRAWLDHANEVRTAAQSAGHRNVFVCPGKCGTCTARGHACGLGNFRGVTIAIGIH
jgi:hypothetical protein